ncbi:metal ABC transporter permease [Heliorestis acidaminivorans]|uniref:Metal ABC transporter permease n=1 Tax=Heliorestis acidaminivorans TaxID=553427 RepID=A0A6I0EV86_9FIRM|nr:iron chelate uptake ABC transporter family permease subunit [Heliorestis acidaminivorans]KAB2953384.1 metal ABC transporter permease [Heliorestis acidaminivorans]
MIELFNNLFFDHTLRTVALGAGALGIVSGALGSFAVLRRQSLLGDAISHAALPGIALAFLLTGNKSALVLLSGAAIAGAIATWLVTNIAGLTRVKYDSALGIILSVFFGFGLVLLTYIQKQPNANQAGLEKYLFGQAAAIVEKDVLIMAGLGLVALFLLFLFWKEFKLLSFDRDFGTTMGYPMALIDFVLTTLLVLAIVIGLQTVGVVLMSAMLIAPAVAARQWTDNLAIMVLLAAFFGALAGVSGTVASSTISRMPAGPAIVVAVSFLVVLSILFAPRRGVIWQRGRDYLLRQRFRALGGKKDV